MKPAAGLLAVAAGCILAGAGLIAVTWHVGYPQALYCAVGTAATDGCNAIPATTAGELVHVAVMLTAIPLLAAVFALLSGAHLAGKIEARLKAHHDAIHARLDEITGPRDDTKL